VAQTTGYARDLLGYVPTDPARKAEEQGGGPKRLSRSQQQTDADGANASRALAGCSVHCSYEHVCARSCCPPASVREQDGVLEADPGVVTAPEGVGD